MGKLGTNCAIEGASVKEDQERERDNLRSGNRKKKKSTVLLFIGPNVIHLLPMTAAIGEEVGGTTLLRAFMAGCEKSAKITLKGNYERRNVSGLL